MTGSYHATVLGLVSSTHFAGMEELMLIFLQRKTIISRIRKTSLAKSKPFLS